MSEIRNIPDVKDASGIFKFDSGKKAIIVPISAVEGLEKAWEDYARETGTAILPYHKPVRDIEAWEELIKKVMWVIEGTCHTNDLSRNETEDDLCFALEQFAKKNNLPKPDWDFDKLYEELNDQATEGA